MNVPPYLKKGDTIGITCPAGYMAAEKAETCIATLQSWGYNVMVGKTLGSQSENYFSGTDEERLDELQAMLDDKNIHAILFGRGGYGMGRIVDQLNFTRFKKNPKWVIGFSDITVLHTHLAGKYNTASLHAPMAAAFNDEGYKNEYIASLKNALAGKKANYKVEAHPFNRDGKATGRLIGGNLALLVNMIGTASDFDTKNKILFIEDIGEYLYSIDRMLYQLKRSGKLKKLAGLVLGGFTDMKDTERPFGKTIDEILTEVVGEVNYPVCFHFPVSHDKENYALKVGGEYQLSVGKEVRLKEI
ncbi:LD-carboxypeptidase [Ferruginibacter sp. HRS2-29]|uniref:S66 peptidase family protein n=1 Tax=Ferruginibacter sp. HRS2-29 TaxID=2487334 RepID=UPI0020CD3A1B|nr:LD-carboxypeptidase [Ferruginibacter sp. HRS2-29]MCP9751781.1 LD-carboxypeptidase [Ferruginibacter sp. HRS2-29]